MKAGDLVICSPLGSKDLEKKAYGLILRFNEKGEGGKHFVKVLCKRKILTFLAFDVEIISRLSEK